MCVCSFVTFLFVLVCVRKISSINHFNSGTLIYFYFTHPGKQILIFLFLFYPSLLKKPSGRLILSDITIMLLSEHFTCRPHISEHWNIVRIWNGICTRARDPVLSNQFAHPDLWPQTSTKAFSSTELLLHQMLSPPWHHLSVSWRWCWCGESRCCSSSRVVKCSFASPSCRRLWPCRKSSTCPRTSNRCHVAYICLDKQLNVAPRLVAGDGASVVGQESQFRSCSWFRVFEMRISRRTAMWRRMEKLPSLQMTGAPASPLSL